MDNTAKIPTMPPVLVYECEKPPLPKLKFLACMYGAPRGEAIFMNFTGETEEDARDALVYWWNTYHSNKVVRVVTDNGSNEKVTRVVNEDRPRRGDSLIGTVWVHKRDNPSDRKRIKKEELDDYLNRGYSAGRGSMGKRD